MVVNATTPGHLTWWTNDFGGLFKDYSWHNDLSSIQSIVGHLLVMVAYAVLVKWFRNRGGFKRIMEPETVKKVRYWHSMGLSIVSLIMGVLMILHVYHEGRFDSWYDSACRVSPSVGLYGAANMLYTITKIWEWGDSLFLIDKFPDKPLLFLHWFHHMTTFAMAAILHSWPVGAYSFINCFVHFFMYLHYAHPQRWARPFLTTSQLVQFVVVISQHYYALFNPKTCFDVFPHFLDWFFLQFIVVGFFFLFLWFFYVEYIRPSPRAPRPAKKDE